MKLLNKFHVRFKDRKNSCTGFLLIELMMVLALLVVMVLLVSANTTLFHRMCVRCEIEKLYTICRYMQCCAQIHNKPCTLTFDQQNRQYHYNAHKETLPTFVDFGVIAGVKGPPSSPTKVIDTPITFKNACITFNPDGIIQPGTIYLVDRARMYLYALSSPVAQVSYLRMYYYHNRAWQSI